MSMATLYDTPRHSRENDYSRACAPLCHADFILGFVTQHFSIFIQHILVFHFYFLFIIL